MTSTFPSSSRFTSTLFSPPHDHDQGDYSSTPPTPILTEKDKSELAAIKEHFGSPGYTMLVKEGASEKSALTDREMMFLSQETFLRFLKGSKGDLTATITRLEACLVWRRTERVDDLEYMAADCAAEARTGKNIVMGFSKHNQPITYFFPSRNSTPLEERRVVHGIFMLERAYDLMPAGVTNTLVVFNFSGKRQGPPTSISAARQTIHILSAYYPESLGVCIFQDMPWIVKGFVNLMWPFVDPVTKGKVKIGSSQGKEVIKDGYADAGQLLKDAGGDLDIPYDHDTYWPALVETCLRLRAAEEGRWRSLGERQVGREERLFKRAAGPNDALIDSHNAGEDGATGVAAGVHPDLD
ncbi:hypothetical protein IAU59_004476 [Kwoniella sp. CBS 9459]